MAAALRAWIVRLWRRASAPVEMSEDDEDRQVM